MPIKPTNRYSGLGEPPCKATSAQSFFYSYFYPFLAEYRLSNHKIYKFQKFLDSSHVLLQKSKIEYLLFGHLGDCHLHFHLIPTKVQQPKALEVYNQIIESSTELGGVYSAEHGTGKRKCQDFIQCFGEGAADQVRNAKVAMDPDFLLNRGNVVEYKTSYDL